MPCTCMCGLQCCNAPTDGANTEARGSESWCMISTAASAREQSRTDLTAVLTGTLLSTLQPRCKHPNLTADQSVYFCQTVSIEIVSSVIMKCNI